MGSVALGCHMFALQRCRKLAPFLLCKDVAGTRRSGQGMGQATQVKGGSLLPWRPSCQRGGVPRSLARSRACSRVYPLLILLITARNSSQQPGTYEVNWGKKQPKWNQKFPPIAPGCVHAVKDCCLTNLRLV